MSWLPVARYHGTTRGRQHGAGAGSHTTTLHWPHRGSTHTSTSFTLILLVTKLTITKHLHRVPKSCILPKSSWSLSTSLH